jgi:hypothetical protein
MPHPIDLLPGAQEALSILKNTIKATMSDFGEGDAAARALTEAVTNPDDPTDPVPDHVWDQAAKHFDQTELAALLLATVIANAVDRLSASTRQSKGMS